jgi:hypothetical protein
MIAMPLQYGFTLPRWQRSINLMLEKTSGSRIVDKLQIIHLFEADLNFIFKLICGKRLMHHAEDNGSLGADQHGTRSGRRAKNAVLEKLSVYDFSRVTRSNVIRLDKDAKACYDRIIRVLAMIACMSLGLPLSAATMLNKTHDGMIHRISTLHGVSDVTYSAQDEGADPLERTGQGSGGSPAIWTIVCVSLLKAFSKFAAGIQIFDPLKRIALSVLAV